VCITVFTRAPNVDLGKGERGSEGDVAAKELEALKVFT
jgi:hypothetical protein